ncbi:MAG: hypothetical protein BMS9Abin07_1141 [Acidimicrobiia bacterium]|nr:MAG: hypothetical protein BMS9Abin07_1141 [Acidimicrobiia bacterium]
MSVQADETRRGVLARLQIRHLYPLIVVALYPFAATGPISDNSFLWHVRAGEAQWDLGRVLSTDVFSYSMADAAWRTQSWLAELSYSGLEAATGTVGWAPAMVTIIGIATMALIGVVAYGVTKSMFATALWLFIAVWLAAPFANPRPVIFSYLLLAALVLLLRLENRLLWAVPALMWVWAAVHGSWAIGIGLLVLVAIRRRSWRVAFLAGVSLLAVSVTAHGLGVWQILLEFAANRDALEFLAEWGRPNFLDIVQGPFLLVVAGVVAAFVRRRIPAGDLWIVIPFLLAGLTTQRTVFPAAIVLLPYAALAIDIKVPIGSGRRSSRVAWVMAVVVMVLGVGILLRPVDAFDYERFPSDEVLASLQTDRFFHDDGVGGYLIYRDWPEDQVYIDDRAELYGAEFFAEHRDARLGTYRELFERYQMTEAIVRPRWPLEDVLRDDGWTVSYEDEFFVVMRSP